MFRRMLVIAGLLSCLTVAAYAQTNCNFCPGSSPTVGFYVYFPNGSTINTRVPVSSNAGAINTVRQVMVNAPCASAGFSYSATGYCPYGGFVNTINSVSAGSSYWELYINGISASCGLDTCLIKPGDYIYWCVASSCGTALKAMADNPEIAARATEAGTTGGGESHQATIHKARGQRPRAAKE